VKIDLAVACPLRHALHFGEVEGLAAFAPYGRFNLDGADRDRDPPGCATDGFPLDIIHGESGFAGGESDEMKTDQLIGALRAPMASSCSTCSLKSAGSVTFMVPRSVYPD
jgi:hypothetical protein